MNELSSKQLQSGNDRQTAGESPRLIDTIVTFVNAFFMAIAMAPPHVAKFYPEDHLSLRVTGQLQLIEWLFIGSLQFIGVYAISGVVEIGVAYAVLGSSIVIFAERQFMAYDYVAEGEYLYARMTGAGPAILIWIACKRLLSAAIRICIAVFLATVIVLIAAPMFLGPETQAVFERDHRHANEKLLADSENYEVRLDQEFRDLVVLIPALEAKRAQLSQSETANGDAVADALFRTNTEIEAIVSQQNTLRAESERATQCAKAEDSGIVTSQCPEVKPSGAPGCGPRCRYWEGLAISLAQQADNLNAQIEALNERSRTIRESGPLSPEQKAEIADEIKRIDEQISASVARRDKIRDRKQEMVAEYEQERLKRLDYVDKVDRGFAATYDAIDEIWEGLSDQAKNTLIAIDLGVILLELAAFFGRLLGATPSFSLGLYLRRKKRMLGDMADDVEASGHVG